eukprot:scaffold69201_cov27-Prasinocladus_malaysianus.AAC.1
MLWWALGLAPSSWTIISGTARAWASASSWLSEVVTESMEPALRFLDRLLCRGCSAAGNNSDGHRGLDSSDHVVE